MSTGTLNQDDEVRKPQAQIGLRDIIALVIRRKWIILAISLSVISMTTFVTLTSADRVTASARLMVIGRDPETPTFDRGATNWDLVMSTAAQVAGSIPVAELAAAAIYDSVRTLAETDPSFPVVSSKDELRHLLLNGVDCQQVGESNILEIAFSHASANFALIAVGALEQAYIIFNTQSQQNLPAVEYYDDQIREVQADIDSLLAEQAAVLDKAGAMSMVSNVNTSVGYIRGLANTMFEARSTRKVYQTRLESLLAAIAQDSLYTPLSGENGSMIFQAARSRLDDAEKLLSEARVKYQDGSEWIKRREELVRDARTALLHERDNYIRDLRIRVEETLAREKSLEDAYQEQMATLSSYPEVSKTISSLDMRTKAQTDLLEALQLKRGEVQLKAQSDSRISNLYPLDEPSIAASVVGSKKFLYLALSFLFAIVISLIVAWFVDNQDHRILDRTQAERSLEVPVLGSISADRG